MQLIWQTDCWISDSQPTGQSSSLRSSASFKGLSSKLCFPLARQPSSSRVFDFPESARSWGVESSRPQREDTSPSPGGRLSLRMSSCAAPSCRPKVRGNNTGTCQLPIAGGARRGLIEGGNDQIARRSAVTQHCRDRDGPAAKHRCIGDDISIDIS